LSGQAAGQAVSIQVPPVATLFSRYKQALASARAELKGDGVVDGHDVFFLWIYHCALIPFPGHPGSSLGCGNGTVDETAAVDKNTYLPVAVYGGEDTSADNAELLRSVELVSRARADLSKPARIAYPPATISGPAACPCAEIGVRSSRRIAPPSSAPPSLAGLALVAAHGDLLSPAGLPRRTGVELVYGSSCSGRPKYGSRYVVVQEAPTPELAYGTQSVGLAPRGQVPLVRRTNEYPECAAPKHGFYSGTDRHERVWTAEIRHGGAYVAIMSPVRLLTIAATRALLR
jgi:hypothetical protein